MTSIRTLAAGLAITTLPGMALADSSQWQGAYLGFQATQTQFEVSVIPGVTNDATSIDVYGGYNYAVNPNWVVGAEIVVATGDSVPYDLSGGGQPYGFAGMSSLNIRGGYAVNNFLIYAGAGISQSEIILSPGGTSNYSIEDAYNLFVGGEMMVNEDLSVRMQYTHSEGEPFVFGPSSSSTAQQISIGATYHLN